MSEELLSRLLRSTLVENEVDPGMEEAVMQALTTPGCAVLRQLAEPVDLEEDIFSALQAESASVGIQKGLWEEVDLEGDIFAALEVASPAAALREALSAPIDLEAGILGALDAGVPALREALSAPVDLEGDIFAALNSQERPLAALLQGAVQADVELEAGVMGALEGDLRGLLSQNLASEVDLEAGVMAALEGDLRGLLSQNLASEVDLEAGVMAALLPPAPAVQVEDHARPQAKIRSSATQREVARPVAAAPARPMRWAAALVSLAAAAAMAFLVVRLGASSSQEDAFVLADRNVAEVEDLSSSATASVQVMQFEENGPTFILVDEGAVSDKAVPL